LAVLRLESFFSPPRPYSSGYIPERRDNLPEQTLSSHALFDLEKKGQKTLFDDFEFSEFALQTSLLLSAGSYMDSWLKAVDWSGLKRLGTCEKELVRNVAPLLTNLESFRFGFIKSADGKAAVINDFLLLCPLLRHLEPVGLTNNIAMQTLLMHAETLESLTMHEQDRCR
jgi:hypothetical protein